mgnify:CR=1 FL=1
MHAISTLEVILDRHGPSALAFFITPNAILTLSGARAFFDGVIYTNRENNMSVWLSELNEYLKTMEKATATLYKGTQINTNYSGDEYLGFFIILEQGLIYTLSSTKLLKQPAQLVDDVNDYMKIIDAISVELRENPELDQISDDDIRHTAFGILLGYPDKAIVESHGKWNPSKNINNDKLIDAKIKYADFYRCPQPVYSYPKYLLNDPDIRSHEILWSSILRDFYESDFHKKLTNDPSFIEKARELGLFEKY